MPTGRRPRLTTLLAAAVLGVYLLIVVGATAALADAAAACGTWPLCTGSPSPAVAVALGHRAVTALVGGLVLVTAVAAWRRGTEGRVRWAVAVAMVLYPVQIAVGALVATTGAPAPLPAIHLLIATGIFAALVVALAWHLESETATVIDTPVGAERTPAAPDPPAPAPGPTGLGRVARVLRAYVELTKPRLMWLLCLVAVAAMALAAGPDLAIGTVGATLAGGVLAIGASGTFNHVLERDLDRRMDRTNDRPIVTHQVPVRNAIAFGIGLAVAAVAVLLTVNPVVAALGLAAILFYSVVYTLVLKPNTVQNTVLGGAAGALPALIGWAAVTGRLGLPGLVLAGLIFVWTPAHFYNLALAHRADYERAGVPMLPVVRGPAVTRKHILLYLGATLLTAGGLASVAGLGWLYAGTAVVAGAVFLWAVVRLHRDRSKQAAYRAFHASNTYLGLLLVAIVVDALVV